MEADGGKSRVRLVMREAPQLVFPVLSSLVFLSIMLHYDASMLLKAFLLVAMGVTLTALITHMLLISAPVEIPLQIARRLILSTDFRESVLSFFREVVMNPDVKNLISESFISVSRELVQDVRKSGALLTIVDNVLVGVPSSYVRGSTEEEEQRSASLAIVRGDSSQSNVPESTSSLPMESSSSLGGDAVRVEYDSLHTDDPSYHAILSRVAAHRRLWGPGPTYPLGAALPTILAPLVARCGCDERTKRRIIMITERFLQDPKVKACVGEFMVVASRALQSRVRIRNGRN